jgi:hypothetical protein
MTSRWHSQLSHYAISWEIAVRIIFIPETNKHHNTKEKERMNAHTQAKNKNNLYLSSNAFSHAYIAFQHSLSYSIRDEQPKM